MVVPHLLSSSSSSSFVFYFLIELLTTFVLAVGAVGFSSLALDGLGGLVLVLREQGEGSAPLHLLIWREHRLRHLDEPVQAQSVVDGHRGEIPCNREQRDLKN